MSESNKIVEATETIITPAPSWAPVIFAVGVLGLIASVYAANFMFPQEWYGWVGIVFVIGALISFGRKGRRAFYSLPREQGDVRAELPVASIPTPARSE
jgi:hypothetical protein